LSGCVTHVSRGSWNAGCRGSTCAISTAYSRTTRVGRWGDACDHRREVRLEALDRRRLVEGELVDALWREQRVIVELDGFAFHKSRAQFEADRARDAKLQVAGYRVLRITQQRLQNEPEAVLEDLRRLLSAGRAAWAGAGR
jgi:very-short-patch-repair endonuclease